MELSYYDHCSTAAEYGFCGEEYYFDKSVQALRALATKKRNSEIIANTYDIVSYDKPPAKVKVKDEDEHYVMWAM